MPKQTPATLEDRQIVTVEQLLRLKRAEQPTPEFWEKFDAQMQQRMLHTLVTRKRSLPKRVWHSVGFLRHAVIPGMAAMLVVAGISMNSSTGGQGGKNVSVAGLSAQPMSMMLAVEAPVSRPLVAPVSEDANLRFVLDSLQMDAPTSGYTKVMKTEAISITPTGSIRYVADPLGSAASRFLIATTPY